MSLFYAASTISKKPHIIWIRVWSYTSAIASNSIPLFTWHSCPNPRLIARYCETLINQHLVGLLFLYQIDLTDY